MNPRSERKPSTRNRMIIMIFFVGGFLALLIGWNIFGKIMGQRAAANMPVPPQTVTSTKVSSLPWQPEQNSVGTLRAAKGADLAFDVGEQAAGAEAEQVGRSSKASRSSSSTPMTSRRSGANWKPMPPCSRSILSVRASSSPTRASARPSSTAPKRATRLL